MKGKKGQLTAEEEVEDQVEWSTYLRLYTYLGGWKLLIPFTVAVSMFTRVEHTKELAINSWAHSTASD
jgi:hypothetical protein